MSPRGPLPLPWKKLTDRVKYPLSRRSLQTSSFRQTMDKENRSVKSFAPLRIRVISEYFCRVIWLRFSIFFSVCDWEVHLFVTIKNLAFQKKALSAWYMLHRLKTLYSPYADLLIANDQYLQIKRQKTKTRSVYIRYVFFFSLLEASQIIELGLRT